MNAFTKNMDDKFKIPFLVQVSKMIQLDFQMVNKFKLVIVVNIDVNDVCFQYELLPIFLETIVLANLFFSKVWVWQFFLIKSIIHQFALTIRIPDTFYCQGNANLESKCKKIKCQIYHFCFLCQLVWSVWGDASTKGKTKCGH